MEKEQVKNWVKDILLTIDDNPKEAKSLAEFLLRQLGEEEIKKSLNGNEYYARAKVVINKFSPEFEKGLLRNNAYANACVEALIRGESPYKLLEYVIQNNHDISKALERITLSSLHSSIMYHDKNSG